MFPAMFFLLEIDPDFFINTQKKSLKKLYVKVTLTFFQLLLGEFVWSKKCK